MADGQGRHLGQAACGRAGLELPACHLSCSVCRLSSLSSCPLRQTAGERMRTGGYASLAGGHTRAGTRGQAHARAPRGGRVPVRTLHIAERELL